MARFVVEGGTPLRGEITPAGNKNEALPLIAASLLTDEPVTLHNLPRIRDVRNMLEIASRSEEHTSELQSRGHLVCRLLLEKKKEQPRRPASPPPGPAPHIHHVRITTLR